jgi:hypothetical protein
MVTVVKDNWTRQKPYLNKCGMENHGKNLQYIHTTFSSELVAPWYITDLFVSGCKNLCN